MTTYMQVQQQAEKGLAPKTLRLTAAQALLRYLAAQSSEMFDGSIQPLFGGVWGIYGHGNVAGLGEALNAMGTQLSYFRGQSEQGMGNAAVAFAKAHRARRVMGVTTSIGPGATNLVTTAALAAVNRLPVLFLPGDIFASRRPNPVLQQVEDPRNPNVTANSCLAPVCRYFDVLMRPEQILTSAPRAVQALLDPVQRGPVTLAFPQDVQTEAYDFPEEFFTPRIHYIYRPSPDTRQVGRCAQVLARAKHPLIVAGGGVHYSGAIDALRAFAERHRIPVVETQAGKGALEWDHPLCLGGIGVTGTRAANTMAQEADVVLCVGTRLSDFTTASKSLFAQPKCKVIGLNISELDAQKIQSLPLIADAASGLRALGDALGKFRSVETWEVRCAEERTSWFELRGKIRAEKADLPNDAQVLMSVNDLLDENSTVVCAAGGIPGELHRHWQCKGPQTYHAEYGYSCMGYEIAGALGAKMAQPEREIFVFLGDGSYLMLHTELLTSIQLGLKLNVILLNNHGFGCIHRLQQAGGSAPVGNLLQDGDGAPLEIDFVANARSYGCHAVQVDSLDGLVKALKLNQTVAKTCVTVIETDPQRSSEGYAWWDVALAEVSEIPAVRDARVGYQKKLNQVRKQW